MIVIRFIEDEEVAEPASDNDDNIIYTISEEVHYGSARTKSVVFIKHGLVLEVEKSISSQLRVMPLNDASPYETLHSYVSAAVSPYFKSYVKETGRAER